MMMGVADYSSEGDGGIPVGLSLIRFYRFRMKTTANTWTFSSDIAWAFFTGQWAFLQPDNYKTRDQLGPTIQDLL